MSDREILLTISILVSGQPDNVRRCLESLQELRAKVSCELLITDTGCPAETRAIVEKYADEIIPFVWCKDFSKARNVGLQRARGKWFLFLDDDEWFEDTREIADFFLSGEYVDYHHACYYQRNYSNREGSKYNDAPVLRMMEKTPETTFVYSIHECLYPVNGTGKNLNCYVHHYGYVYDTWEQKLAKSRRNIELLQVEYANHPLDLHHALQLVQEYGAIREYEESLRISKEAIATWEKHHKQKGVMGLYVNSLMTNVLQCLLLTKEYQALLEQGTAYLEGDNADPLAKALIYGRMAVAAYELNDFDVCLAYVKCYHEAYLLWEEHPEYYYPYETSLTKPCFERNLRQVVLQCGIRAALKSGDYQQAHIFAEAVDWSEGMAYINQPLIRDLMTLLNEVEDQNVPVLVAISNTLRERKALEPYFADSILEQENPCWSRYGALFRERSSDVEETVSPEEPATLLQEAYRAMQNREWKQAVAVLKEVNQRYPSAGELVKKMLEQISSSSREEQNPNREFAALAVAVKQQARLLIGAGQAEQAKAILLQLHQMLPEDEEILQMLNACN